MARDRRAGDRLADPPDRPRRLELDALPDPGSGGRARTGSAGALRPVREVFAQADGGKPAGLERRDGVHGGVRGVRPVLTRSADRTTGNMDRESGAQAQTVSTSIDDRHIELAEPLRIADD